jgi:hypothetical protein
MELFPGAIRPMLLKYLSCNRRQQELYVEGDSETPVRGLFKKTGVLPLTCEYILSLMLFIIDSHNDFRSGLQVHGLNIRNKNQLCLPIFNLSAFQKGTTFSGIKLFNSLPSTIQSLRNDRDHFKNSLHTYLI